MRLNAPLANATGTCYMGYLPLGSLVATNGVPSVNLTLAQLINNASTVMKMTG